MLGSFVLAHQFTYRPLNEEAVWSHRAGGCWVIQGLPLPAPPGPCAADPVFVQAQKEAGGKGCLGLELVHGCGVGGELALSLGWRHFCVSATRRQPGKALPKGPRKPGARQRLTDSGRHCSPLGRMPKRFLSLTDDLGGRKSQTFYVMEKEK